MRLCFLCVFTIIGSINGIFKANGFIILGGKTNGQLYQTSIDVDNKETSLTALPFDVPGVLSTVIYDTRNKLVFFSNYDGVTHLLNKVGLSERNVLNKYVLRQSADGLAVDPAEKLLFYSFQGSQCVMVRDYGGLTDHVMVSNAAVGSALDTHWTLKRLFFMDFLKGVVESCNYDGSDRKIIFRSKFSSFLDYATLRIHRSTGMVFSTLDSRRVFQIDSDGNNEQVVFDYKKTSEYLQANDSKLDYQFTSFSLDKDNIYLLGQQEGGDFHGVANNYLTIVGQDINARGRSNKFEVHRFNQSFLFTGIADNYPGTPPEKRSACTGNNECSDLCIPKFKSYTCTCNDTYRLEEDHYTCKKVMSMSGPLLLSTSEDRNSGTIMGVPGNPRDYLFRRKYNPWFLKSQGFTWNALDINYEDSQVILFDTNDRCLSIVSLNGTEKVKTFDHVASSKVYGVAYDWVNKNIYWTDAQMNWIKMCDAKGLFETTIMEQNLEQPHGIAVHPLKGLLFWTDRGEQPMVMQSDLAGNYVRIIANKGLDSPKGIAVDYHNNILYWTNTNNIMSYDITSAAIKSFDFDTLHSFQDITIYMNFIVTSGVHGNGSDYRMYFRDLQSPNVELVSMKTDARYTSVKMYDESRQPRAQSACAEKKCAQLCVPRSKTPYNRGHVVSAATGSGLYAVECLCSDGYITKKSKVKFGNPTCIKHVYNQNSKDGMENELIIFASSRKICQIGISQVLKKEQKQTMCQVSGGPNEYRSLAYNYEGSSFYYSRTNFIYRSRIPLTHVFSIGISRMDTSKHDMLFSHPGYVTAMVYDWMSGMLYCSDSGKGIVWVTTSGYTKVILRGRNNVWALELDLKNRKLFWSESHAGKVFIMMSDLDGQNIREFHRELASSANHTAITSLSFDYVSNRLYWVDNIQGNITSSGVNNKDDVTTLFQSGPGTYAIAAIKDFVAFTGNKTSGLLTVIDQDTNVMSSGYFGIDKSPARDVIAFTKSNQPDLNDRGCSRTIDRCEQLCFNKPKSEKQCACIYGQRLVGKSENLCAPNNLMTKGSFILLASIQSGQIYQSDENLVKSTRSFSALKLPPYQQPKSIAYDYSSEILFWSDGKSYATYYMNIQGKHVTKREDHRVGVVELDHVTNDQPEHSDVYSKMHFDVYSGLLYTKLDGISVGNREGTMYRHLISKNYVDFKIDPPNGYIYAMENGFNSTITRYDMDGNKETLLLSDRTMGVNFAIDFKRNKIYWLEDMSSSIYSCDISGGAVTKVVDTGIKTEYAVIEVHNGNLLVNTPYSEVEHMVYYDGKTLAPVDLEIFVNAYDMLYIDKDQETKGRTACSENNGNCTHFCVPLPNKQRTCVCPIGWDGNRNITRNCLSSEVCQTKTLEHGQFSRECHGREGAHCEFTCSKGFRKRVDLLSCWNGKWDTEPSTACIMKTCPTMQAPSNSHLNLGCPILADVGTVCWTNCDPGAKHRSGDAKHECLPTGQWSGKPIKCTRDDCLNTFEHGHFIPASPGQTTSAKGVQAHYECFLGYTATDDNAYTCLEDGQWNTDTGLLCRRKRCHISEIIKNALNDCTFRDEIDSSCNYQCKHGFVYKGGSVQRFCQEDQTWDGQPIRCEKIAGAKSKPGLGIGAIIGIVCAALVLVTSIIALGIFFSRRKRNVAPMQRKEESRNGLIFRLKTKLDCRLHHQPHVNEGGVSEAMHVTCDGDHYRSTGVMASRQGVPTSTTTSASPVGPRRTSSNMEMSQSYLADEGDHANGHRRMSTDHLNHPAATLF